MRIQCRKCEGIVAVPTGDMGKACQCGHCGEVIKIPKSRLVKGAVISEFMIKEKLNTGETENTYLAQQISMDRDVLLKVLKNRYAKKSENVLEFIKEIRSKVKKGPQPCEPIAVGEDEGIYFQAYKLHAKKKELSEIVKTEIKH